MSPATPAAPRRSRRWFLRGAATAGATAAVAATAGTPAGAAPVSTPPVAGWRASWTTPLEPPNNNPLATNGFTDTTLRFIVRLSAGGQVRLRFANPYGESPIVVGPVTVARRAAGAPVPSPAIDPVSVTPVTFGGAGQALLAAGANITSDPVDFVAKAGSDLVVSAYLPGPTGPVSFHLGGHSTQYVSAPGDHTAAADAAAYPTTHRSFLLINRVDVRGGRPGPTIAAFGDSITEGSGSPDDTNERWPDFLARRMARAGQLPAVANLGIGGNRLVLTTTRSENGQARFDRDVVALPNLRTLIIALGINDVQASPSQTDPAVIVAGHRQLVTRAHDHGLYVIGATLAPFEGWGSWRPEREAVRLGVNDLIRAGDVFDAVVDFDAALRDPSHPSRMLPAYDSGDHLHPNAAGMAALANAIDLAKLR